MVFMARVLYGPSIYCFIKELSVVLSSRQVVKAFVILSPHFTGDKEMLVKELQDHVKETTAPYKYPRKVRQGLFLEWILQNKAGHLMMFT